MVVLVIGVALWLLARSGSFLVIDDPRPADVIVVLAGEYSDVRYWRGLELLRAGRASRMMIDTNSVVLLYGRTPSDYAGDFVQRSAGDLASRVSICRVVNVSDSVPQEARGLGDCLDREQPRPHSLLLVTHDYQTRRAVSVLRNRLPSYQWSVASAHDPYAFNTRWWARREWAKTNLTEWEKLASWQLVERWRR